MTVARVPPAMPPPTITRSCCFTRPHSPSVQTAPQEARLAAEPAKRDLLHDGAVLELGHDAAADRVQRAVDREDAECVTWDFEARPAQPARRARVVREVVVLQHRVD